MDLLKDSCVLTTVQNWHGSYATLYEFVDKYIVKTAGRCTMLKNLSNMHIFAACASENDIEMSKWKEILSPYQFELLCKNKSYIIGCMLVDPVPDANSKFARYIDWIDTLVPRHNIASFMIDAFQENDSQGGELYPKIIIASSAKYWLKHLKMLNLRSKNHVCQEHGLSPDRFDWDELFKLTSGELPRHVEDEIQSTRNVKKPKNSP
jgi:hypothetical protein